ncbi:MAG: GGDEF domain-containing protein [Frankiales bacterium]|nr:GGDEF domain-containing protein [Frankiales bacterium]
MPIHSPGGYSVGTLCVFDPTPREVTEGDLAALLDLAAMVDDVIAARVAATVDELTGVQNRAGFLRAATPLLRLADRADTAMTLGFFDVNGLKQINDELGHEAGDAAIAAVGRLLRESFRAADVIGRLGGDEFAVLYAVTDEAGATTAFRRFEQSLHEASESLPFHLGVAVGFVTRTPNGPDIEQMLTEADIAMYARKRSGAPGNES